MIVSRRMLRAVITYPWPTEVYITMRITMCMIAFCLDRSDNIWIATHLISPSDLHFVQLHYGDVIMGTIASQITSLTIVYSTVYSGASQRNIKAPRHWPLSPDKWPVTRKMFPFDDVIMYSNRPMCAKAASGLSAKMFNITDRDLVEFRHDFQSTTRLFIWHVCNTTWMLPLRSNHRNAQKQYYGQKSTATFYLITEWKNKRTCPALNVHWWNKSKHETHFLSQ